VVEDRFLRSFFPWYERFFMGHHVVADLLIQPLLRLMRVSCPSYFFRKCTAKYAKPAHAARLTMMANENAKMRDFRFFIGAHL
jgi:hypothetical protein